MKTSVQVPNGVMSGRSKGDISILNGNEHFFDSKKSERFRASHSQMSLRSEFEPRDSLNLVPTRALTNNKGNLHQSGNLIFSSNFMEYINKNPSILTEEIKHSINFQSNIDSEDRGDVPSRPTIKIERKSGTLYDKESNVEYYEKLKSLYDTALNGDSSIKSQRSGSMAALGSVKKEVFDGPAKIRRKGSGNGVQIDGSLRNLFEAQGKQIGSAKSINNRKKQRAGERIKSKRQLDRSSSGASLYMNKGYKQNRMSQVLRATPLSPDRLKVNSVFADKKIARFNISQSKEESVRMPEEQRISSANQARFRNSYYKNSLFTQIQLGNFDKKSELRTSSNRTNTHNNNSMRSTFHSLVKPAPQKEVQTSLKKSTKRKHNHSKIRVEPAKLEHLSKRRNKKKPQKKDEPNKPSFSYFSGQIQRTDQKQKEQKSEKRETSGKKMSERKKGSKFRKKNNLKIEKFKKRFYAAKNLYKSNLREEAAKKPLGSQNVVRRTLSTHQVPNTQGTLARKSTQKRNQKIGQAVPSSLRKYKNMIKQSPRQQNTAKLSYLVRNKHQGTHRNVVQTSSTTRRHSPRKHPQYYAVNSSTLRASRMDDRLQQHTKRKQKTDRKQLQRMMAQKSKTSHPSHHFQPQEPPQKYPLWNNQPSVAPTFRNPPKKPILVEEPLNGFQAMTYDNSAPQKPERISLNPMCQTFNPYNTNTLRGSQNQPFEEDDIDLDFGDDEQINSKKKPKKMSRKAQISNNSMQKIKKKLLQSSWKMHKDRQNRPIEDRSKGKKRVRDKLFDTIDDQETKTLFADSRSNSRKNSPIQKKFKNYRRKNKSRGRNNRNEQQNEEEFMIFDQNGNPNRHSSQSKLRMSRTKTGPGGPRTGSNPHQSDMFKTGVWRVSPAGGGSTSALDPLKTFNFKSSVDNQLKSLRKKNYQRFQKMKEMRKSKLKNLGKEHQHPPAPSRQTLQPKMGSKDEDNAPGKDSFAEDEMNHSLLITNYRSGRVSITREKISKRPLSPLSNTGSRDSGPRISPLLVAVHPTGPLTHQNWLPRGQSHLPGDPLNRGRIGSVAVPNGIGARYNNQRQFLPVPSHEPFINGLREVQSDRASVCPSADSHPYLGLDQNALRHSGWRSSDVSNQIYPNTLNSTKRPTSALDFDFKHKGSNGNGSLQSSVPGASYNSYKPILDVRDFNSNSGKNSFLGQNQHKNPLKASFMGIRGISNDPRKLKSIENDLRAEISKLNQELQIEVSALSQLRNLVEGKLGIYREIVNTQKDIKIFAQKHNNLMKEHKRNKDELKKKYQKQYEKSRNIRHVQDLANYPEEMEYNEELKERVKEQTRTQEVRLEQEDARIQQICKKQMLDEIKLMNMRFFNNKSMIKKQMKDQIVFLTKENDRLLSLSKKG